MEEQWLCDFSPEERVLIMSRMIRDTQHVHMKGADLIFACEGTPKGGLPVREMEDKDTCYNCKKFGHGNEKTCPKWESFYNFSMFAESDFEFDVAEYAKKVLGKKKANEKKVAEAMSFLNNAITAAGGRTLQFKDDELLLEFDGCEDEFRVHVEL